MLSLQLVFVGDQEVHGRVPVGQEWCHHFELPVAAAQYIYSAERLEIRTEPMARKNEKVAALLSIYCESVGKNPRGPAPFL